jgi:predicted nucleotidyltransferase
MRLADEKIRLLKSTILSILPSAKVYLFGSRVDDNKKGGDIDILIIADRTLNFIEEGQIERNFFKHYGAQKLDLVSFKETDKAPFKTALMNAIQL